MDKLQFAWYDGDKNRPLRLYRPCSCGCDFRDGEKGVGYISGSNSNGAGMTIWIKTEAIYQALLGAGMVGQK